MEAVSLNALLGAVESGVLEVGLWSSKHTELGVQEAAGFKTSEATEIDSLKAVE